MKLVRFAYQGEINYGLLEQDSVRLIKGSIFEKWEQTPTTYQLPQVTLLAPVDPPNIIAIGLNYRKHALEGGFPLPKHPLIFFKATTSVTGPEMPIYLPKIAPDEVDYEAELAIVIGKKAKEITLEEAPQYILGYTCSNDVSARDCQLRLDQQWARGKSFDTFCPLGPAIETEVDPNHCRITSRLNGEIMQDSNTEDLIFNINELVSFCSHNLTLLPGTVIMTGTPSGVGYARKNPVFMKAGDLIEIEIEGIGVLRNRVAGPATC